MRTNSDVLQTATDLRRAVTALASRARAERSGDLTLNHVAVLGRVAVEGPVTPGEIGAQLGMTPQSLTRPLAALERRGLVVRTPDPADGRGSLIHATEDGLRALREEMAPRDHWVAEALAEVCSEEEQDLLAQAAEVMLRLAAHGGRVARQEP